MLRTLLDELERAAAGSVEDGVRLQIAEHLARVGGRAIEAAAWLIATTPAPTPLDVVTRLVEADRAGR